MQIAVESSSHGWKPKSELAAANFISKKKKASGGKLADIVGLRQTVCLLSNAHLPLSLK